MVFQKVFYEHVFIGKKVTVKNFIIVLKHVLTFLFQVTFFVTNNILIIVYFWCKKLSFKEKNNFSGSIFCDQLFCELHFKLIFSETNSNRKKHFWFTNY